MLQASPKEQQMKGEMTPAAACSPKSLNNAGASGKLANWSAAFGSGVDVGAAEFIEAEFSSGDGNGGIAGSALDVAGIAGSGLHKCASTPKLLQSSFAAPVFFGIAVGTGWWVVAVGFWLSC